MLFKSGQRALATGQINVTRAALIRHNDAKGYVNLLCWQVIYSLYEDTKEELEPHGEDFHC